MFEVTADRLGRTPVVILSGFLGSGKTTLLNRILASPRGARVAVVVNEFAEVGIDHHLMLTSEPHVVQANNGCICCGVRGDLIAGLFRLIEMKADFDVLIIEMSGLAEPEPVAQTLYIDERIRREYYLQGVVTVLDAKHLQSQLEETTETANQIAFADLLVLNKTDLVDAAQLDRLEVVITSVNPSAPIVRARNVEIDLDLVLQAAPPQQRRGLGFVCEVVEDETPIAPAAGRHLGGIETVAITEACELDGAAVSLWFRELMSSTGPSLMRMKGVLNFKGDPDRFFFQGVQSEFEGRPGPQWGSDERINRLVFIGRNLDKTRIESGFRNCIATAASKSLDMAERFGTHEEVSPLRLEQIRFWLRQNFGFPKEAPIVIKEVPCMKPACPPIETAIVAILRDEPPRMFKVQHMINEITFDHVYDLMENPMPCC